MKNLMDNPKELERLSKQARLNAEGYSSKYYAERVLDVYKASQEKINPKYSLNYHCAYPCS